MTAHVNVGGTWKEIIGAHVNVGGTWKTIISGWTNVGGTWKLMFASHDLSDFDAGSPYDDLSSATTTYSVNIVFRSAGTIDILKAFNEDQNDVETYSIDPANTWVRCTHLTGNDMTDGDTRGTWHQCDVQRSFEMAHTSGGGTDFIEGTFKFELSTDSSGSPIVATADSVTVRAGESI